MADLSQLEELVQLLKSGAITREEFEQLKAEIITSSVTPLGTSVQNKYKSPEEPKPSLNSKANISNSKNNTKVTWWALVFVITVVFVVSILGDKNKSQNTSESNANTEVDYSSTSTSTTESNANAESYNSCTICGRQFAGRGYEEVSDGVWKPCKEPYECFICSPSCGLKSTKNLENVLEKHGFNSSAIHDNNSYQTSIKCKSCGFGTYKDGFCNYCGTASPERVKESYKNLPKCIGCNGKGWRDNEICPICDGKGVQVY